jgi:predicted ArsR family transcriptional regulator
MSRMSELIYPDAPGFKVSGPSEQAAKAMGSTANKMRAAVLAQFAQYPAGATADEVARDLNLSVLSVRPRVSELKRTGKIKQTGARRKNESGMTATVWQIAPQREVENGSFTEASLA